MLTQGIQASYLKGVQELAKHTGETITAENVQAFVFTTRMKDALQNEHLMEEVFGPCSVGVRADSKEELMQFARSLKGQLTATIHGTEEDLTEYRELVSVLQQKAGRLVINGFPTGVEVSHAMVHGGPFPATTDSRSTSVGTLAIYRFSRPVCLQDFPQSLLPEELKDDNPLGIWRKMNGEWSR
jgi:NADP-dependent aldehyde dehydrogenase